MTRYRLMLPSHKRLNVTQETSAGGPERRPARRPGVAKPPKDAQDYGREREVPENLMRVIALF